MSSLSLLCQKTLDDGLKLFGSDFFSGNIKRIEHQLSVGQMQFPEHLTDFVVS